MKKYVKSSTSYTSDIKRVLQAMRNLQDAIEIAEGDADEPTGFIDEYGLADFYDELTDCIYDFHHLLNKGEI